MTLALDHGYAGSVWVREGKLYERLECGSVECWEGESDSVPTLELVESLTSDVAKYQKLEAYINGEPLHEWLK